MRECKSQTLHGSGRTPTQRRPLPAHDSARASARGVGARVVGGKMGERRVPAHLCRAACVQAASGAWATARAPPHATPRPAPCAQSPPTQAPAHRYRGPGRAPCVAWGQTPANAEHDTFQEARGLLNIVVAHASSTSSASRAWHMNFRRLWNAERARRQYKRGEEGGHPWYTVTAVAEFSS